MKKNIRLNKQIIKALSIGISAGMLLQPVSAYAAENEGAESTTTTGSTEQNTTNSTVTYAEAENLAEATDTVVEDAVKSYEDAVAAIPEADKDKVEEEVWEACKKSYADSFISTLPDGLNTPINSKSGLSEGQRQMIAIARVMLANPEIVILDEATSNIDTRSERLITTAFDAMMKAKTSIVIAHRLSTIKQADIILVLKDGHIIESGNHEVLMKKKSFYYEMYSSQFK